jgi:hypothetical protein
MDCHTPDGQGETLDLVGLQTDPGSVWIRLRYLTTLAQSAATFLTIC